MVDGDGFTKIGLIKTGIGTHGRYTRSDGKRLDISHRGSNLVHGPRHGKGSMSAIDFVTRKVVANWPIRGGGSPDMDRVSADSKVPRLFGRFDDVVCAIDRTTGSFKSSPVGAEPHGPGVWPQPGRCSLGPRGICVDEFERRGAMELLPPSISTVPVPPRTACLILCVTQSVVED